jgi:hypothetical protein|tara:strand:- start:814 stop:987 length:174 start_codon:yes stop_codon:yes gene_type:complete
MSFVSWAVYPEGEEHFREYYTSEHHAVDVAYTWSIERCGKKMIVERSGMKWMEVQSS